MVYTCFACKWRADREPRRSFHKFPSNHEQRQKWLNIIGKSDAIIGAFTTLCSSHFEERCFKYGLVRGLKQLKPGSLPSLHLSKTDNIVHDTADTVDSSTMVVKSCFVSGCDNNSDKNPDLIFFAVPKNEEIRTKWFNTVAPNKTALVTGNLYCCGDHFDLPNDTINWMNYQAYGEVLRIKKDVLPKREPFSSSTLPESEKRIKEENVSNLRKRKHESDADASTSTLKLDDSSETECSFETCYIKQEIDEESGKNKPLSDALDFKQESYIEQVYVPEYQPETETSRFRTIGTMTEVETSTKSTMCVPEDFDTKDFWRPATPSDFEPNPLIKTEPTENNSTSIKKEPEDWE